VSARAKTHEIAGQGLTGQEFTYCRELMLRFDPTKAARAAGYSKPEKTGSALMRRPHIVAALQHLRAEQLERLEIDADDVIRELARVGFSNIFDFYRIGDDGEPIVDLTAAEEARGRVVKSFRVRETQYVSGEVRKTLHFELHDKMKALELLARHFGLLHDNLNVTGIPGPDEQRKAIEDLTPAEAAAEWSRMVQEA